MGRHTHYKFCVMGNPIEHSLSPQIHEQFAKQFNLNISYTKKEPEINKFKQAVTEFMHSGGYGFNITTPFKQEAFKLADQTSERAKVAGAVNTIILGEDGLIQGDNTDGVGFIKDITINLNYSLADKKILILGAGGAARGILQPLLVQKPKQIILVNRTDAKAQQLVTEFKSYGNISSLTIEQLVNLAVDVIIDARSLGSQLLLPETLIFNSSGLCYDLKYNLQQPTHFTQWAKTKGMAVVADGIGMLVEQAAESFFIWTGQRPETKNIIRSWRI